jgi:FKBP-type peptidyl-prolyl cis-trans isomerase 2
MKMTQAKQGDSVKVHYTGKLDDGTVFDSSVGREPLEFTVGAGQLIAGFDEAVVGMAAGEQKTVRIAAEQAYGPHNPEMTLQVPRSDLPAEIQPELGMQLEASQEGGHSMVVTVVEVSDESVTFDANHPLAGKALTFEIEVVELG